MLSKMSTKNTTIKEKRYFCEIICSKESPFEILEKQECTNNCSIKDFYQKKCISNYQYEETNANLILNIILNELSIENFNASIFDINQSINYN